MNIRANGQCTRCIDVTIITNPCEDALRESQHQQNPHYQNLEKPFIHQTHSTQSFFSHCSFPPPMVFCLETQKTALWSNSELPSTYHPCGLLEVGASRVILSHDRKLTELTLLFQEFVFSC